MFCKIICSDACSQTLSTYHPPGITTAAVERGDPDLLLLKNFISDV